MNIALNVFEAAVSKKSWKTPTKKSKGSKPSWDRDNPEAAKLLRWASKESASLEENVVQVELPQKPKKGK